MTMILQLLRLFLPAVKEWWRTKKLTAKSNSALREINQIFLMQCILFFMFILSTMHGVSIFNIHTKKVNETAYIQQNDQWRSQQLTELREQNKYLKERYTLVVKALELYAKEDSFVVLQRLEEAAVIPPQPKATPNEQKPN